MASTIMTEKKLWQKIDHASAALLQGKEGQANELLSHVFDELITLSSLGRADKLKELSQLMKIIHDAQQRRDHVYLVDILQYELPEYIPRLTSRHK